MSDSLAVQELVRTREALRKLLACVEMTGTVRDDRNLRQLPEIIADTKAILGREVPSARGPPAAPDRPTAGP